MPGIPAHIKSSKTVYDLWENERFWVIAIIMIYVDYPCMYSFALECAIISVVTFVEVEAEAQYGFPAEYSTQQHMDLLSFFQD